MMIKEAQFKNEDPRLPKVLVYTFAQEEKRVSIYFNSYRIIGNAISLRMGQIEVAVISNYNDTEIKEFEKIFKELHTN